MYPALVARGTSSSIAHRHLFCEPAEAAPSPGSLKSLQSRRQECCDDALPKPAVLLSLIGLLAKEYTPQDSDCTPTRTSCGLPRERASRTAAGAGRESEMLRIQQDVWPACCMRPRRPGRGTRLSAESCSRVLYTCSIGLLSIRLSIPLLLLPGSERVSEPGNRLKGERPRCHLCSAAVENVVSVR